jgi:DNA-binding MarR family transcriptional regulator
MRRSHRDVDASRTAVAILRADSKVSQALERALAKAGLSLPQFNILMELANSSDGALPLYELTARLISTPPNTSWLATRMEGAGLVTKCRHDGDSRVVILRLTEQGWSVLEKAAPLVFEAEKKLLGTYSRQDLCALANLLDPVISACESYERTRNSREAISSSGQTNTG